MRKVIIKVSAIIFLSLTLCACNGNRPGIEKLSGGETSKEEKQLRIDSKDDDVVLRLNNKVTSFGEYLYVNSMYVQLVFSDKDEEGNYYSWQTPEDLLPGTSRVYYLFRYNNEAVCICQNENGNYEMIIYNSNLTIKNSKEMEHFSPQYLKGNLLYGYSNSVECTTIKTINLDSLEETIIYTSEQGKRIGFVICENDEMIISVYDGNNKTSYFKWEGEELILMLETKFSGIVFYDLRGLFYLEATDSISRRNLMLWDGKESMIIGEIKIDDMNEWMFTNGIEGNIMLGEDFFLSIHAAAEEPYLAIRALGSNESIIIYLEKWNFTEADMVRYGETFSEIYYENGQIISLFFSNKADKLQTKILDIKQYK